MKRQLAAALLFAVAFGTLQLPAQADYYDRHDRNHDGRWNYSEFNSANRYYHHHHRNEVIINNRGEFNRLDHDHDGFINREDMHGYRNWD